MLTETPLDEVLYDFSAEMAKERDKAVKARAESQLEEVWSKARMQYQGFDDVNQPGIGDPKSHTLDGPVLTTIGRSGKEKRSTVFVNITRPYTNAGTARVADILLPTGGKRNWDLRMTPVSDIALLASVFTEHPELGPAIPPQLMARLQQTEEQREIAIQEARTLIEDWLTETKWHSETRNQITECGKVGAGVIKGPFPRKRKLSPDVEATLAAIPFQMEDPIAGQALLEELKLRLTYQPAVECIPVERCFPDMPACGDDIQNGRFFWEEIPHVSALELQDFQQDETYFAEQIAACLEEGPLPLKVRGESNDRKKKSFTRWRRAGEIDLAKLANPEEKVEGSQVVWADLEFINDRVVKISKPALDIRKFQYHVLVWEPRQNSWAGIGIPEQIETPQRGLNASVRAGNDNLGWSVGFQLILGKGIEALDGDPTDIHAYKLWRDVTDQLSALTGQDRSPKDAIGTIEFPNHLQEILPWINFWLQMAESTTGLTLLMQGQKTTDSVGVSQMLMNSSTTNLRMLVKHWDDDVCAPIIQALYEWVQLYGPAYAKSDAVAAPLGSSALITRELQQQALIQLLDRTVQPVYGKSPKKTMDMFLEGMQFDPRQLDLDDEERQQLEQAAAQPDPKVEVEQIRAQTTQQISQAELMIEWKKALLDYQAKGASLDEALEAVETQVTGSLALEQMKQEGELEKQGQKMAMEQPTPQMQAPGTKPEGVEGGEGEPDINTSLQVLGLQ